MSAIVHIMGRPTKDPVMQQAQNGGSEYVLLDIATTQRNQKGENETIFTIVTLTNFRDNVF